MKKKFEGGVHTLGLPSLNAKSLGVGLFLVFANEFETLQTTLNAKFICKVPCRRVVWSLNQKVSPTGRLIKEGNSDYCRELTTVAVGSRDRAFLCSMNVSCSAFFSFPRSLLFD